MAKTFNATITVSQDSANAINIYGLYNKFIVSGDNSGMKRIIIFFFNPDTGKYEDGMNIFVGRLSWRNAIEYALSFDYSEENDSAEINSDCLDEICTYIKTEFNIKEQ